MLPRVLIGIAHDKILIGTQVPSEEAEGIDIIRDTTIQAPVVMANLAV